MHEQISFRIGEDGERKEEDLLNGGASETNPALTGSPETEVEVWKPTKYPRYEVSTLGRVRNIRTGHIRKPALCSQKSYAHFEIYLNGKYRKILIHILVLETFISPRPHNHLADHRNRNPLDNRLSNLRWATHSQNSANRVAKRKIPYRGIEKDGVGWYGRIQHMGKTIRLGYHKTPEAAARAYDKKAKEIHGEFAVTNFVD